MHPLVKDLHKLSDDDVTKTIGELYNKLMIAQTMAGSEAYQQILLLIETYQEEFQKRMQKASEKMQKYSTGKTSKANRDIWDID